MAAQGRAPAGGAQPLRICFERILPHELDMGRGTRHAIRDLLAEGEHGKPFSGLSKGLQGNVQRLALFISKKWPPGLLVKCRFLDGTPTMRARVEKYAHLWEKHEAVRFEFGEDPDAQIRISFHADAGSWSAVGTDALQQDYFPPGKPTMNFGWLRDDTPDEECRRVVLHEFGHALGCVHEHESPKFTRLWNKDAVYKAFGGPPNRWSREEIDANVLEKYSSDGMAASAFDARSIMLYAFSGDLFTDGKGATNNNTRLSAGDKRKVAQMYPRDATPR